MQPSIVACVTNVSMSMGHLGLRNVAAKLGVKIESLSGNQLVLFINRSRNRLKMLGANGIVLGYVKTPGNHALPLEAVQYVARAFSESGKIDLSKAIADHVEAKLKKVAGPDDVDFECFMRPQFEIDAPKRRGRPPLNGGAQWASR